ncbi:hypothetical protein [Ruminococcus flavefaciens]|uniref:Uncharacterized protein n=1 Tax=Ruminococcus flavefaciens TaxID=1265 RepID=A0A315Y3M7_RUMFL|nr:hypothetical protein [Ruminococcus flavefaciens]PWJ15281.1 hypothetical protein IE37_00175 [Ruminococcus flavefaciens]SSA40327.1 hypothetical protein SAMN02910325_00175 [Ruminococcus flavefaciens]
MKLITRAQEDKTTLILLSVVCFLLGVVLGFVLSPIKKGIAIGNNSGNNFGDNDADMLPYYGDDDDDELKF